MGDAASRDAELKRNHDHLNNHCGIWLLKADVLINSAKTLQDARPDPLGIPELTREFIEKVEYSKVPLMLKGMGIECLLKAVWVAKGKAMSEDGVIKKVPGMKKPHDLVPLAEAICPEDMLSHTEKLMLAKLSRNIEAGRYPTIANAMKPETKPEILKETCTFILDTQEEEAFDEMCNRLAARLQKLRPQLVPST